MILGAFCAVLCAAAPWHLVIGPHSDAYGSTVVEMNGQPVGVYVDNETPDQAGVVARYVRAGIATIAGISMATPWLRLPGAINALEWYPFYRGALFADPQPPPAQAYIVQGRFRWPGDRIGATRRERHRLWLAAVARRPLMVLTYDGNGS